MRVYGFNSLLTFHVSILELYPPEGYHPERSLGSIVQPFFIVVSHNTFLRL